MAILRRVTHRSLPAGTVFRVPLSDSHYVVGQILEPGVAFYMCVFRRLLQRDEELAGSCEAEILLIGRTTDALFVHEEWVVLGSRAVPKRYPRPRHVVDGPSGLVLEDFDRNVLRNATEVDLDFYGYETSVAPIAFVEAARQVFGLKASAEADMELSYEDASRRAGEVVAP